MSSITIRNLDPAVKERLRVRAAQSFAEHDLVDPSRRHRDRTRETILRQTHRFDELQQQNLSWGGVGNLPGGSRDFDTVGTTYCWARNVCIRSNGDVPADAGELPGLTYFAQEPGMGACLPQLAIALSRPRQFLARSRLQE
jgi:hypothetical protein